MERFERLAPHDPIEDRAAALFHRLEAERTDKPRLAEPMERLCARLIDIGLELAAFLVTGFVVFIVLTATGHGIDIEATPPVDTTHIAVTATADIAFLAACSSYEIGLAGHSIGKRLMRLAIVDQAANPASRRQLAVRALAWLSPLGGGLIWWSVSFPRPVSIFPFLLVYGTAASVFVTMLRDNDKRGWHDRLAGTYVVTPR